MNPLIMAIPAVIREIGVILKTLRVCPMLGRRREEKNVPPKEVPSKEPDSWDSTNKPKAQK